MKPDPKQVERLRAMGVALWTPTEIRAEKAKIEALREAYRAEQGAKR